MGDREHGGVVDGVAEDGVGPVHSGVAQGRDLTFVGGNGEQTIG